MKVAFIMMRQHPRQCQKFSVVVLNYSNLSGMLDCPIKTKCLHTCHPFDHSSSHSPTLRNHWFLSPLPGSFLSCLESGFAWGRRTGGEGTWHGFMPSQVSQHLTFHTQNFLFLYSSENKTPSRNLLEVHLMNQKTHIKTFFYDYGECRRRYLCGFPKPSHCQHFK